MDGLGDPNFNRPQLQQLSVTVIAVNGLALIAAGGEVIPAAVALVVFLRSGYGSRRCRFLIVIVSAAHDFAAAVSPAAYNVLSKQRVRRRFGFDLLLAREDSPEARRWVEFFQQVRLAPGKQKGY